jgi:hypothetical protein
MNKTFQEMIDDASKLNPAVAAVGFHLCEPESFTAVFQWFRTFEAAKRYLIDVLPVIAANPHDEPELDAEAEACRARVEPIIAPLADAAAFTPDVLDALEEALIGQRVSWIGSLDDLCTSSNPWCETFREEFRQDDDEPDGRPVAASERADFLAHVREYAH